jgi:aspartate kinase
VIKLAKFGGTSLSDDKQFIKVRNIVKNDNTIKYVVASAPGVSALSASSNRKITDLLYLCYQTKSNTFNSTKNNVYNETKNKISYSNNNYNSYQEIFYEISERFKDIVEKLNLNIDIALELKNISNDLENNCDEDYFVSRGEYLNSKILAEFIGFDFVDAKDLILFNKEGRLNTEKTYKRIKKALKERNNIVIPGFYGAYSSAYDNTIGTGKIKTFSRGGSDITGSLVARAANVDIYENWTDISGFMVSDPKIIKNPKKIDIMTYRELRELAYMGATVLHDEAVFPVREAKIPINIRNTNDPEACGTLILESVSEGDENNIITGISGKKNYTIFCINKESMATQVGGIRSALSVFYKRKIAIEHIPTGVDAFSIIVASSSVDKCSEAILKELKLNCKTDNIRVFNNIALIGSVGRNIKNKSSIFRRLFAALEKGNIDIKIIAQGLSEINLIIGVDNEDYENTIKAIYNEFVE